ncbi:MAG: hypothetical protein EON60_05410 [Alphaproteobacteria bacterium]|nr:MAG: hypothetical protein EON60_05410 [Alphaproteobacteria bacterium]
MNIIQGGPKPIVAIPVEAMQKPVEKRERPVRNVKASNKGETPKRYANPDEEDPRGQRVDREA